LSQAPELVVDKNQACFGLRGDFAHSFPIGDDEDLRFADPDAKHVEFANNGMNRGSGHGINIQKSERLASVKSDRVRPCSSRLNMREQRR
jgi:hypothetical protein